MNTKHICTAITIESKKEYWDEEVGPWSMIKIKDTETKETLREHGDNIKFVNPKSIDLLIEANMDGSLTIYGATFEVSIDYHNTTTINIS